MNDLHNLQRFVNAQDPVYAEVIAELRAGRKESHWMWFIFPQVEGLGRSSMAQRYAIASAAEAKAYMEHPVLGPRLMECSRLAVAVEGRSVEEIFGWPDCMKFRSSMTLFAHAAPENGIFRAALEKYFHGEEDRATVERLT